jgi:hypothetical protein
MYYYFVENILLNKLAYVMLCYIMLCYFISFTLYNRYVRLFYVMLICNQFSWFYPKPVNQRTEMMTFSRI